MKNYIQYPKLILCLKYYVHTFSFACLTLFHVFSLFLFIPAYSFYRLFCFYLCLSVYRSLILCISMSVCLSHSLILKLFFFFHSFKERPRPEYAAKAPEIKENPITGNQVRINSKFQVFYKALWLKAKTVCIKDNMYIDSSYLCPLPLGVFACI